MSEKDSSPNKLNLQALFGGGAGASGAGGTGLLSSAIGAISPYGTLIGGALSIGSSIFAANKAKKAQRKAEKKEKAARKDMTRLRNVYANLDTSNPFLNQENVMEDLTVNQQASQFQQQQFQQSQSNILEGLRGAAGGGGVAALAQQLSQSGQLAAQRSSVDIGQQEARNQMAERRETSRLQGLEIQGEYTKRAAEKDKTSTLLGMAQQETAQYAQQVGAANQARMDAITGGIKGAAGMVAGFGDAEAQSMGPTSDIAGVTPAAGGGGNQLPIYDAEGNITGYRQGQ